MSEVKSLTSKEELQELLQGTDNLLLDLYAEWCPPCRQLMPILDLLSLEEKYKDIKFVKINTSLFPDIARQYEVTSIPTLIFISKDRARSVERHTGFIELEILKTLIDKYFF